MFLAHVELSHRVVSTLNGRSTDNQSDGVGLRHFVCRMEPPRAPGPEQDCDRLCTLMNRIAMEPGTRRRW